MLLPLKRKIVRAVEGREDSRIEVMQRGFVFA
jgi:hypothetical protein